MPSIDSVCLPAVCFVSHTLYEKRGVLGRPCALFGPPRASTPTEDLWFVCCPLIVTEHKVKRPAAVLGNSENDCGGSIVSLALC